MNSNFKQSRNMVRVVLLVVFASAAESDHHDEYSYHGYDPARCDPVVHTITHNVHTQLYITSTKVHVRTVTEVRDLTETQVQYDMEELTNKVPEYVTKYDIKYTTEYRTNTVFKAAHNKHTTTVSIRKPEKIPQYITIEVPHYITTTEKVLHYLTETEYAAEAHRPTMEAAHPHAYTKHYYS